ncbi:MAG: hypothetical protein COB24_05155 [Hyphomicrobiales bacterium]|nr:MAG: hypothetical protein COB24_05155 [Hyphomicrobiales bacterium]
MNIYSARAKQMLLKLGVVGLAFASLVASGATTGTGTNTGTDVVDTGDSAGSGTGAGASDGVEVALILLNPSATLGTYTEDASNTNVSANLTFRANSAFFSDGAYSKVQGHEVKVAYGKTEVKAGDTTTSYVKKAGEFSGILTSATVQTTLSQAVATLSASQLSTLNTLRTDIKALEIDIKANPTDVKKSSLKTKLEELADLISYDGLQISLRSLVSGNGFYGLFVNEDNGDYKQLSGIYAMATGKSIANYATLQSGGGTTAYNSKFSGAAAIAGIQLIDLKGSGTVSADFSAQTLTGSFAVSNETNTEAGSIAFSGAMSANAGGVNGLVFNSTGATYTTTKGLLSDMTGGSAEAALVDGGESILGSVNITGGGNAVVGAFGGDK